MNVTVKFKKLSPLAVTPSYSRDGDAGADLVATSILETDMYIEYGTGLSIELLPGFACFLYPRSSLSNYDLILANHVGVGDSNFRGEITFRFKRTRIEIPNEFDVFGEPAFTPAIYKVGDRIGQLVVQEVPRMLFEEVEELEQSNRGSLGYGSSGV